MKKLLGEISLTRKVLLLPLITILLMAVAMGVFAGIAVQNSYESRVRHIIEQTVEETSRYVSAELRNTVALVHFSLIGEQFQQAMKSDMNEDLAEYIRAQDTIISQLRQLQMQGKFIDSAALSTQGRVFYDGIHAFHFDIAPLLEAARERSLAYWSDEVLLNNSTGRAVIPLVLRVPSGDFSNVNESYILINLDAEGLFAYMTELETSLDCSLILSSGEHVLYDRNGIFDDIHSASLISSNTPLEINDWNLYCVMNRSQLYASRNSALIQMTLATLLVVALCAALAIPVSQSILRPVRSLTEAANRVAGGDYTARTEVTGGDELGRLGRTFDNMAEQIQQNIRSMEEQNRRIAVTEQQKRQAEMRALQSQINPHFLYNTLDSVYWYAMSGRQKETGILIETLSDMLRIALSKGSEYIPLEKELRHAEDYLRIQSIIHAEKFTYEIQKETSADFCVLKVLLQPLVENSINHGFESMERGGEIRIRAWEEDDFLCLSVTDNGCGFELAESRGARREYSGFALQNLSDRLRSHYGGDASLLIRSEAFCETCVEIRISRMRCSTKEERA